jgi:hypothetical protein
MRRHDKAEHMERVNRLFEQRCNENKFSWDGKYANEELEEGDEEDYQYPYDLDDKPNDIDYFAPDKEADVKSEGMGLPGDFEPDLNKKDVDEVITNITTDAEAGIWFSNIDGQRRMDKNLNY